MLWWYNLKKNVWIIYEYIEYWLITLILCIFWIMGLMRDKIVGFLIIYLISEELITLYIYYFYTEL